MNNAKNTDVTKTGKFLMLNRELQLLYFHLQNYANEKNTTDGYFITRLTGYEEKDLQELERKGFIKILDIFYTVVLI